MPSCPIPLTSDVLDLLGNMIAVKDPAAQELISWALKSHLRIVITRTHEAAISCKVSSQILSSI